jgi:hypothetical protein
MMDFIHGKVLPTDLLRTLVSYLPECEPLGYPSIIEKQVREYYRSNIQAAYAVDLDIYLG